MALKPSVYVQKMTGSDSSDDRDNVSDSDISVDDVLFNLVTSDGADAQHPYTRNTYSQRWKVVRKFQSRKDQSKARLGLSVA